METFNEPFSSLKKTKAASEEESCSELSTSLTEMAISDAGAVQTPASMDCENAGGSSLEQTAGTQRLGRKPSGAQLRKAAKQRALERGEPIRPRKKKRPGKPAPGAGAAGTCDGATTSRGADTLISVDQPLVPGGHSGAGFRPPLALGPVGGGAGASTPGKRRRNPSTTPPSASNPRTKRARGETLSQSGASPQGDSSGGYSGALSTTKMVVIHGNHPVEQLSEVEANLVLGEIVRATFLEPAGQGPQFTNGYTSNGVVHLTCSNSQSKGWLEEKVGELRPWDGATLRTGPAKLLLEGQVKVGVWIPTDFLDRSDARKLIPLFEVQNPGLSTKEWRLLNSRADEKGMELVLTVDKDSLEWLKGQNFKPHFHTRRVTFRQLSTPPSDAAGHPNKPAA